MRRPRNSVSRCLSEWEIDASFSFPRLLGYLCLPLNLFIPLPKLPQADIASQGGVDVTACPVAHQLSF